MENITKVEDHECDWYWIPNDILEDFKKDSNNLAGKSYLEAEELHDSFISKYGQYATGGGKDNIPDAFM